MVNSERLITLQRPIETRRAKFEFSNKIYDTNRRKRSKICRRTSINHCNFSIQKLVRPEMVRKRLVVIFGKGTKKTCSTVPAGRRMTKNRKTRRRNTKFCKTCANDDESLSAHQIWTRILKPDSGATGDSAPLKIWT